MDITSLLGNVMDKDMLEKLSKSANVSTADVSNVLKNAAPSVMKHLDGDSVKDILNKAVPMLKELLSKQGGNVSDMLGGIAGKLFK